MAETNCLKPLSTFNAICKIAQLAKGPTRRVPLVALDAARRTVENGAFTAPAVDHPESGAVTLPPGTSPVTSPSGSQVRKSVCSPAANFVPRRRPRHNGCEWRRGRAAIVHPHGRSRHRVRTALSYHRRSPAYCSAISNGSSSCGSYTGSLLVGLFMTALRSRSERDATASCQAPAAGRGIFWISGCRKSMFNSP